MRVRAGGRVRVRASRRSASSTVGTRQLAPPSWPHTKTSPRHVSAAVYRWPQPTSRTSSTTGPDLVRGSVRGRGRGRVRVRVRANQG